MKKNPLITVYITNYNYGNYIEKCISSVLEQTYENYEIIIIDDGSKDNSKKILKKFEKNNKIRIIYQKNRGLNISNNIAIKLSRGKYIIRVDADDWLKGSALEVLYNEISKDKKIAMVFSNYYEVDKDGFLINEYIRHDFSKVKLLDKPAHGACSLIDKKKILMVRGYNTNFNCQDGYDIWFKFITKFKVKHVNKSLFYYRQHEKSLSTNKKKILSTRSKILDLITKKTKRFEALGIITVRGPNFDINSNVFKKLKGKFLLDWTLEQALRSKLSKIIISTPDKDVISYIRNKYKSSKIKIIIRENTSAALNTPIDKVILDSFKKFKTKNNKIYDAIMSISIEAPFRNYFFFDTMIDVMKIFKTDSVVAVKQETDNFFKHTGTGLKILNNNQILKLERNEIFRQVGKFYLIGKKLLKKKICLPSGNIGHIMLDDISAISIDNDQDWKKAERIKL